MRKHEVLRETPLGPLELGFGWDEPVDEPDNPIPEWHFRAPMGFSAKSLEQSALRMGLGPRPPNLTLL
jgi:hypothetical protein